MFFLTKKNTNLLTYLFKSITITKVMRMTMNELAKLANVSVSTVSKAFSDADDVSEDTKDLVFAIAKEQGCFGKFYKGKYHKKIIE